MTFNSLYVLSRLGRVDNEGLFGGIVSNQITEVIAGTPAHLNVLNMHVSSGLIVQLLNRFSRIIR